jgi:hypothetical protein
MKKRDNDTIYLAPSLSFERVLITNLVVSKAEMFEIAAAIPWGVLQVAHVLRCRANGRSTTMSGPDSTNER